MRITLGRETSPIGLLCYLPLAIEFCTHQIYVNLDSAYSYSDKEGALKFCWSYKILLEAISLFCSSQIRETRVTFP